jgi:hypothetical protein
MKFLFHHLICQSCHVISLAGSEPPVLGTRAHHSKSTTNKLYDNVQRTTPAVFIATRKCCKHPSIETLDSEQVSASTSAKMATRVIWCALPRWLVQFPLWLERWDQLLRFEYVWPMLSSGSLHGKANKNCEINVNQQMIVFWESCKSVCLLSLFSMSSLNTAEHLTFPFSIFLLSSLARQLVC